MKRTLSAPAAQTEWLYVPDVPYRTEGDLPRAMQCIIPYRRSWDDHARYPLVVFVPGAAWQRQEMYNNLPALSRLARRGYAVASVQVREAALAAFPAQVEDIRHALAALSAQAEAFHWDMERVVLAGDSSGAHLALMAMLTASLPCDVRGVIDLYGPTDLLLSGGSMTASLLGLRKVLDAPEAAVQASCGPFITPARSLPPVLIAHGLEDDVVSIEHSRRLYQRLLDCGHTAWLYEVEHAGHGGDFWWSDAMLDVLHAFITGLWPSQP